MSQEMLTFYQLSFLQMLVVKHFWSCINDCNMKTTKPSKNILQTHTCGHYWLMYHRHCTVEVYKWCLNEHESVEKTNLEPAKNEAYPDASMPPQTYKQGASVSVYSGHWYFPYQKPQRFEDPLNVTLFTVCTRKVRSVTDIWHSPVPEAGVNGRRLTA